jgi:hypothetical protein
VGGIEGGGMNLGRAMEPKNGLRGREKGEMGNGNTEGEGEPGGDNEAFMDVGEIGEVASPDQAGIYPVGSNTTNPIIGYTVC